MSNAAKKSNESDGLPTELARPDLATEREAKLANNFADPELEKLIPILGMEEEPAPGAIVQEAADAIQELFVGNAAESLENTAPESGLELGAAPTAEGLLQSNAMVLGDATPEIPTAMPNASALTDQWWVAEELFRLVACELPFNNLVEGALGVLVRGLDAEAGSVLELDFNKHEFFFRASLGGGDPEQLKAFRVPRDQGIVGHVAESLQFVHLGDEAADQRQLRAISMSTGFEVRTVLAGPIVVANQLYGVVELFNKKSEAAFSESDARFLEQVVTMLAKVLEVRFLMAELARRAR